ncbi:unnamed protein product [Tenebrio molitor]|nr:unnamed protein product [Tenebrio molitor]
MYEGFCKFEPFKHIKGNLMITTIADLDCWLKISCWT